MKNLMPFLSIAFILIAASCKTGAPDHRIKISNKGVNIAYTDKGRGAVTLLFVHGWCINKTYWQSQVAYFSKRYRVVTIDLAGYGQSGKNRKVWTTQSFATDVDAVITQLHLNKVVLIGHSMAGEIVVEAAIHNPKTVIAIAGIDNFKNAGLTNADSIQAKKDYDAAIYELKHHFQSMAKQYVTEALFYKTTGAAVRQRVLYDVAHADTVIAAASLEQNNLNQATELKKANKPLFLINSDVNKTDTAGLHQMHIPVQLFYIHATGHFPMVEKPGEFNCILNKALTLICKTYRPPSKHCTKRKVYSWANYLFCFGQAMQPVALRCTMHYQQAPFL